MSDAIHKTHFPALSRRLKVTAFDEEEYEWQEVRTGRWKRVPKKRLVADEESEDGKEEEQE